MVRATETPKLRIGWLLATLAAAVLMLLGTVRLLEVETDIVAGLPADEPEVADALYFLRNHPLQDRVVVDIGLKNSDIQALNRYAARVEADLLETGLFSSVGMADVGQEMPGLIHGIAGRLCRLFSAEELEGAVLPLLEPETVQATLHQALNSLSEIGSPRTAALISRDPLELRNLVLARLAHLFPADRISLVNNRLISRDGRHVMVIATPKTSATQGDFAAAATAALARIADSVTAEATAPDESVTLTLVGAFRAAYDNETIIRRDVQKALIIATLGIALLLVLGFSRPWIGLLALSPALFGTLAGLFVYALVFRSISLMVLGFGGAIISITVDHGIAYLLFLDRPGTGSARKAAREIRSVGLAATLTTVGAFAALSLSRFPILDQLGKFTALGIGFSFLFIHTLFPRILTALPPRSSKEPLLARLAGRLRVRSWKPAVALGLFTCLVLPFAWPEFDTSLSAMNTVSRETREADKRFAETWGDTFGRTTHVMIEAESKETLSDQSDPLLPKIRDDLDSGALSSGFCLSMIFPGSRAAAGNLAAWRNFWTRERVDRLRQQLVETGTRLGFTPDAFEPFLATLALDYGDPGPMAIPEGLFTMLGIHRSADRWFQSSALVAAEGTRATAIYDRYQDTARLFNPDHFSDSLGRLLSSTFRTLFAVIAACLTFGLLAFFADAALAGLALLPVLFAFVATLGTLKLIGHPLDLPALMLSIVVFGMGIDYSLFQVRSFQRYRDDTHPSLIRIRLAVIMAAFSTVAGFGVLLTAEHSLLRSAGLTSLLGIAYSLAGALFILPPLLRRRFCQPDRSADKTQTNEPVISLNNIHHRVRERYKTLEAFPRMFARFKLRFDPMFTELPDLLAGIGPVATVIDIGSGNGVPGCWLLEAFPGATLTGIEPDPESCRVAGIAMAKRGRILPDAAPSLPVPDIPADLALFIDISHFLPDPDLDLTLERIKDRLNGGGHLFMRCVIPPGPETSLLWKVEGIKLRIKGVSPWYRSIGDLKQRIADAGFRLTDCRPSGNNPELFWFIAKVSP